MRLDILCRPKLAPADPVLRYAVRTLCSLGVAPQSGYHMMPRFQCPEFINRVFLKLALDVRGQAAGVLDSACLCGIGSFLLALLTIPLDKSCDVLTAKELGKKQYA